MCVNPYCARNGVRTETCVRTHVATRANRCARVHQVDGPASPPTWTERGFLPFVNVPRVRNASTDLLHDGLALCPLSGRWSSCNDDLLRGWLGRCGQAESHPGGTPGLTGPSCTNRRCARSVSLLLCLSFHPPTCTESRFFATCAHLEQVRRRSIPSKVDQTSATPQRPPGPGPNRDLPVPLDPPIEIFVDKISIRADGIPSRSRPLLSIRRGDRPIPSGPEGIGPSGSPFDPPFRSETDRGWKGEGRVQLPYPSRREDVAQSSAGWRWRRALPTRWRWRKREDVDVGTRVRKGKGVSGGSSSPKQRRMVDKRRRTRTGEGSPRLPARPQPRRRRPQPSRTHL